ncbi:MAG: hypothetical protein IPK68_16500 [Bdellovibrionales bacterium]|nr:hypothetical protein [Bdellovibrionales bacterium]
MSVRVFHLFLKSFFRVFTVLLAFCEFSAQARVFNLQSEYLASYLRGTAGTSRVGDEAFRLAGGSGTSYDDKVSYNFSGQIGFLLRFKGLVTFRVGAELLQTKPLVSIPGKMHPVLIFFLLIAMFLSCSQPQQLKWTFFFE